MSKNNSRGAAQAVARSMSSTHRDGPVNHPRRNKKSGPATKASRAEPTPPAFEGYKGSRKGSVVALHRTNIGVDAAEVKTEAHHATAHRGSQKPKASSVERIVPVSNSGIRRFGRSRNHPSKRASD